ncbi:MAG: C40 family peptidase, partial [Butyrivibrio sp.]|nr:C40 family peptidase [Butyrivibrio sp.]
MYAELDRYIGMEYVWGGSNPSTGFDCSGYVCWVINHCGNGWNVGRQTANGLKHITASVPESDVHAGDLIFFQGTYATSGASHVGIVVDPVNHIMAHAGNPIKYSSYDTSYWHSHAYGYGRLP